MQTFTCFRAERCFHRCGSAVLLLTLVACADDNPVAPGSSPVPSNPTTPSPSPAPPDAPGSVRLTLSRVDVVFNAMAGGALRDVPLHVLRRGAKVASQNQTSWRDLLSLDIEDGGIDRIGEPVKHVPLSRQRVNRMRMVSGLVDRSGL